jgi:anti-sigma-K factor RskA
MSANHDDFATLVDGYVLGTLTEAEARTFTAHLATCDECRRMVREVSTVTEAMARALPQEKPSPALRAQVLAAVETANLKTAAVKPTVKQSAVRPPTTPPYAEPARGFAFAPWLAAAATIRAVIASGLAWQYRQEAAHSRGAQEAAATRVRSLEQQVARLQADARTAVQTRSVLAAVDLSRVDLAGKELSPAATGRVFWSPTHGLVFAATNLPALPPGRVYQLWVVADTPISAGIGTPAGNGEMSVVSSPSAPPKPKAFALTVEPEGGSPAPTTPILLIGSY